MGRKKLNEKDFYLTLWKYFTIHGSQRIKLLNFYIVLECFFINAFFTLTQKTDEHLAYKAAICVFMIFFSLIFRVLDLRTNSIIKIVEKSIRKIEKKNMKKLNSNFMIFSIEKEITDNLRKKSTLYHLLSYSKTFIFIYLFFPILGIIFLYCTLVYK
jgi:hypothetical protein